MAVHHTPDEKANAVARVLAGESRRKVADDVGVNETTVRRWVRQAAGRETPQAKKIADTAEQIRARIEQTQEEVRELLLQRIRDLVPKTDDLRAVATAFGIVTDKAELTAGRPTGRFDHTHRDADPLDAEIQQLLSEEAARAAPDTAGNNGHA